MACASHASSSDGLLLDHSAEVDEVFQPAGDALLALAELPLLGSVRRVGSYFLTHRSASWVKIKRPSQTGSRKGSGWGRLLGRLVYVWASNLLPILPLVSGRVGRLFPTISSRIFDHAI